MPSLSLIVITKNEEASIARCLSSLDFADDIVVVDSGSTDRTVELARAMARMSFQRLTGLDLDHRRVAR